MPPPCRSTIAFTIDNPSYLQTMMDGMGSTCREAFNDALDCIAQGDTEFDSKAKYVQELSDVDVDKIWNEFQVDNAKAIITLDQTLSNMYAEADEANPGDVEMYIYCALCWEEE